MWQTFGVVMNNIAIAIGIGIVFGVTYSTLYRKKQKAQENSEE